MRFLKTIGIIVAFAVAVSVFSGAGWIENRVLTRHAIEPIAVEHVEAPCELKGQALYCTEFEAYYLTYCNIVVLTLVGFGCLAFLVERLAGNRPKENRPPEF